jgi:flagellar assembly protein FliH
MAVIKSHNAAGILKEAIVLDLGDLGRQAAKLQAAAEAKARKIIGDAEQQAAKLIEDARTKGRDEGRAQGTQEGIAQGRKLGHAEALQQSAAKLQELQQAWINSAKDWDTQREEMQREAPQRVLELALGLAEKLVHRVIQVDPTVIVDQVANALAHVLHEMDVTIRVCPADRPVLEEAMPELVAEFSHLKHVRIVDDPEITPGGCIVSYGQGQIDTTIDTQLTRLVELMLPADHATPDLSAAALEPTTDEPTP